MSQFIPDMESRVTCALCQLVYDIYPKLDRVENYFTLELIRNHVRAAHGVRKAALSAAIAP